MAAERMKPAARPDRPGPIDLLAIDLDDTLLTDDLTIPAACVDAVRRAQAYGVRVVLATGRMFRSALPYARQLALSDPLICYNGALIASPEGEALHHEPVPAAPLAELIDIAGEHDLCLNLYVDDRLYVKELTPQVAYYTSIAGVEAHPVGDLHRFLAGRSAGSTKALVVDEATGVDQWLPQLTERFAGRLAIARSKPRYIEVMAPGVDKGRALASVAKTLSVLAERVMAIGDSFNDLGMLAFAGWPVAMGNAPLAVRERARAVTGTNDAAGVAQAIEEWILPRFLSSSS